jgi:hypothetical protein
MSYILLRDHNVEACRSSSMHSRPRFKKRDVRIVSSAWYSLNREAGQVPGVI